MPNIGPMEIILLLGLALLLFGAKRLPEIGRSLGSGMREFKDSVTGDRTPSLVRSFRPRSRLHLHRSTRTGPESGGHRGGTRSRAVLARARKRTLHSRLRLGKRWFGGH